MAQFDHCREGSQLFMLINVQGLAIYWCVCVQALADSVSNHKRATADGQCREENLLQETASKEAAMATRMEELQAELKQARMALANSMAENERLGVLSTQLKKVPRMHFLKIYLIFLNLVIFPQRSCLLHQNFFFFLNEIFSAYIHVSSMTMEW